MLIADEPTTALDVMVQAQVLRLLADLQRDLGLAIIFITHDLSTLANICRRIAVMYAGRIVEEGPNDQVFADAAHPYTRALAAAFPVIGDLRFRMNPSGLPGDPPDPRHVPSGCPFHPRCSEAIDVCPRTQVELWPAGDGREAACVHVSGSPVADVNGSRRALVEVRDLHVQYPGGRDGPARAVDGVNLDVYEGETLALVGESGCGKTTLARAIMGLHRPTSGEIRFRGEPLSYDRDGHARAPPPGADDLPGPDRRAERAPDALRGGGRGHPHPEAPGQRGGARGRGARRARGCARPRASSRAIRTRSRAASASA